MTITYQYSKFNPDNIVSSYIGITVRGIAKVYDVNKAGCTIRETIVNLSDYPTDIQEKALALAGKAFNQVKL